MSSISNLRLAIKTKLKVYRISPFWLGLLLVVVAAVLLRVKLLNSFPLTADEGIHLVWLRLLAKGYQPYSEVYITYPPLYPLAIKTIWDLWPIEVAQRWFSVAYTVFGVIGTALLARRFAGMVAGVVAAALLLFSPVLFEFSRAILGEFPSVAWSVWAIWLAWLYKDGVIKLRLGLILSAVCLAVSLLTKFLSPFLVAFIPLVLLARWLSVHRLAPKRGSGMSQGRSDASYALELDRYIIEVTDYKTLLADMLLWGGILLLAVVSCVMIFDIGSFFGQVVGQRLGAREVYIAADGFWQPRYNRTVEFVSDDVALMILALVGLSLAWGHRRKDLWLMLAWLGLALAMLAIHSPIRYKHFLILLPILATFGGLAVSFWLANVRVWLTRQTDNKAASEYGNRGTRVSQSTQAKIIAAGGAVLLIALYLWQIPTALALWQAKAAVPQPPSDEVEALAFIREITAPDDCLITDDMPLLYWSGRMTPPELTEVSTNRLKSGALTLEELIAISDKYDCQVVAAVSNRIPKFLPDYMEWAKTKYLGVFHYGEDDLFFAKVDTEPNPVYPLWANFDNRIIFHGYDLTREPVSPGSSVPLKLVWQAQTELDSDYAIFAQLRDADNNTLASADHQPYKGLAPTSTWPKEAVIQEVTWLSLPPDISAGQYYIYIGLYNPESLNRLPLLDDTSGENALILGPLVAQ